MSDDSARIIERMEFVRSGCRDIKIMLAQMIARPNTRTVGNVAECKRILLLIDKTAEQFLRGRQ